MCAAAPELGVRHFLEVRHQGARCLFVCGPLLWCHRDDDVAELPPREVEHVVFSISEPYGVVQPFPDLRGGRLAVVIDVRSPEGVAEVDEIELRY